uniref:Retrotransposon gag domain-containing protein n=1 Tax=Ananas comosus var. bracteatus TaxID=296719 RepID=A0A6V7Q0D1_ANACO|nr:unnamed protein product [Ananas comosus var. bracteatus]
MSPRRYVRRSVPAPSPEVPEEAGSSEVQELRAQVSALAGIVQRQESRFEQLQGLMERHLAAATAAATEGRDSPPPPARAPTAAEGEGIAAVPVAARPPAVRVPPAASGCTTPDATALEAERERALAALKKFRKFNPPTFEGEKVEPWMVESWVDSMETLFEDLCTLEKDKVYLATHCLERTAKVWWKRVKRARASDLPPLTWEEFRGLFYVNYFPDSEKKKLQEQFRKLKQGSRTVAEYEREFSHIIDCVPDVVRDDRDRADWFERGLWADIYRAVHILKLTTFAEVLDRALWADRYCPVRASPAPSVASAPANYGGAPPAASSAGRAMVPRQPEKTRLALSGRVFAAQTQAEEPAEAEDRHVLAVRKECSSCPVQLVDWIMPIRMLVFKKLKDFDVILGMDWLSKYYATIHCRSKVITFRESGQEEFVYRVCRSSYFAATVSATRARKLVNSGSLISIYLSIYFCPLGPSEEIDRVGGRTHWELWIIVLTPLCCRA